MCVGLICIAAIMNGIPVSSPSVIADLGPQFPGGGPEMEGPVGADALREWWVWTDSEIPLPDDVDDEGDLGRGDVQVQQLSS